MENKKTKKILKCSLSDEELLKYGDELAGAQEDVEETERHLSEVKADFKARLESFKAIIGRISRMVRNKYEMRDTECTWVYNWEDSLKTLYRDDTREVVKELPIPDDEKQSEIPFDAAND